MGCLHGGTDSSGSRAASQDILYPLPYMRPGTRITGRLAKPLLLGHRRHGLAGTRAAVCRLLEAGSGSRWLVLRSGALLLALFWLAVRVGWRAVVSRR